jgi:hypothetical protein
MAHIVWIVEIDWSKSATPSLEVGYTQNHLLEYLCACCPYFVNRSSKRYTLVLNLQAERLSEAEQKADELLKQALQACNLPWPASRRKICDITSQR